MQEHQSLNTDSTGGVGVEVKMEAAGACESFRDRMEDEKSKYLWLGVLGEVAGEELVMMRRELPQRKEETKDKKHCGPGNRELQVGGADSGK